MPDALPTAPTERLAGIIAGLASCVAAQGGLKRLAGPLVVAIWTRLQRMSARFRAVAATPPRPPRAPGPWAAPAPRQAALRTAAQDPAPPPVPRPPQPRGACWLVRLVPGATAGRSQLQALLRDPEMAALLAADPRLGRILRPLCWMLGVDKSLAPPPRPRRRRKPPAPVPPAAEPGADPAVASAFEIPPVPHRPPVRINLHARDLLSQLRMGPSPIWD